MAATIRNREIAQPVQLHKHPRDGCLCIVINLVILRDIDDGVINNLLIPKNILILLSSLINEHSFKTWKHRPQTILKILINMDLCRLHFPGFIEIKLLLIHFDS